MQNNKGLAYEENIVEPQKKSREDEVKDMSKVFWETIVLRTHQKPLNNLNYKSFPYGA